MTTDIQTTSFHIVHSLIFLNFKKELDCSGTKLKCFFSLVVDAIHLKKETGSSCTNKKNEFLSIALHIICAVYALNEK